MSKINKSSKTSPARNSSAGRLLPLDNISQNQLNSFLSIRKFEQKNFVKIGKSGVSAKSLVEESEAKKEFLNQNPSFMNREYSKSISQLRIPASVPLIMPNNVKKLVKRGQVEKISIVPDIRANRVKIKLLEKSGNETIIIDSKNSIVNQSIKDAGSSLRISEDSKLIISIPISPPTLESSSSKNQGNVLYKMSLKGVEKENA